MDSGDLWKLAVLVLCLVLSAFFSVSETAFIALSRVRLLQMEDAGRPGDRRVARLMERPQRVLATVLLGNNLVNTAAAALATAIAISLVDNPNLAVLAATIGVTLVLLIFCETLPKTLAWSRSEEAAFAVSRPLVMVGWVLSPAVTLLQGISLLVSRAFGIDNVRAQVTEDEIRTMISLGARAGTVEPTEAEMLEKVFHFGDRQVHEVMTPRTEIVWVEKGTRLDEFLKVYGRRTRTRLPVYEGDTENIVGLLSVKDLMSTMAERGIVPDSSVTEVVRPVYFVPETKLVGQLFGEMRERGQQMAIIIDQYGGVAGLVTLKSLLEVIVGPVREEGEDASEEFEAIGENVYDVDGGMGIQEANEELGLDLPEGNYQTLAGFILEQLGHIPQEGEHLYYRDLRLQVTEMKRVKIERVQVHVFGRANGRVGRGDPIST